MSAIEKLLCVRVSLVLSFYSTSFQSFTNVYVVCLKRTRLILTLMHDFHQTLFYNNNRKHFYGVSIFVTQRYIA